MHHYVRISGFHKSGHVCRQSHPEITIQQGLLLANISSCTVIHVVILKPTIKPFILEQAKCYMLIVH